MLGGWRIRSDIPFAGVRPLRRGEDADITISIAPGDSPAVAKNFGQDVIEHSGEGWLIKIRGIADYEIIAGRQIRIWPAAGVAQKDIEIFLFGLAWATLCHQRGLLPLHASAISTRRGIVAFAGRSGAGKSTTAAWMTSLGHDFVTDDMLPISFDRNGIPGARPYLRRFKLQADPITRLSLTPMEIVSETRDNEKYFVPAKNVAEDKWHRLDRIYVLDTGSAESQARIEQITGADSVRALVDHTYYLDYVLDSRRFGDHLALCTRLALKVPVYRLRLPPLLRADACLQTLIGAHVGNAAT
jgi:hypothetical protein